jgi:S1-C subfamily serine protease
MIKFILPVFLFFISLNQTHGFFGSEKKEAEKKIAIERNDLLAYEKNTIDIFKNISPSVVNVSNNRLVRRGWLFESKTLEVPAGMGTGFVWDKAGHIITNFHVIQGGNSFTISFKNNPKQYQAKLVGVEPAKDIAVLKLEETPKNLVPIQMGVSSNLVVGQKAMAIGSPFGLDQSITSGIISALGRKIHGIGGVSIYGMIQTDCSINPGNSGGPLLDSAGKVIGMNTMIFSNSGSSAGVGFAVPADTISRIVPELIKYGRVMSRPVIGVGLIDDNTARYYGFTKGVVIKEVFNDGPAEKAGLKGTKIDRRGRPYWGDVIIAIDDKPINNYDDIYHVLEKYKKGDRVTITYLRDEKKKKVKLELTNGGHFD